MTQIAASIAEFGFVNPVLVDAEGVLIAGHGRVAAAKQLETASSAGAAPRPSLLRRRVPTLADNRIALNSGWDEALLAAGMYIRDEAVVDLDVLGFSGMELDRLLARPMPVSATMPTSAAAAGGAGDARRRPLALRRASVLAMPRIRAMQRALGATTSTWVRRSRPTTWLTRAAPRPR